MVDISGSTKSYESRIHDIVFPGDVRENDRIAAMMRVRGDQNDHTETRVWRVSPFGIEVLEPGTPEGWSVGQELELEITIGGERRHFEGLIVDKDEEFPKGNLLGIRFLMRDEDAAQSDESDRRAAVRWICAEDYLPLAVAAAPGLFNEFLRFQVRNISKSGLELYTSLLNKFLLKGMTLSLMMTFPLVGQAVVAVRIARISIKTLAGKDMLSLGVEIVELDHRAREIIAQYLVQFSDMDSLDELRDEGFDAPSETSGMNFRYVKTEDDYRAVLRLRAQQVQDGEVDPISMGEIQDQECRLAVATIAGRIVISARIGFPNSERGLEAEGGIAPGEKLPRRDEIIEVCRLCVDKNAHRPDIILSLLKFICATCISASRPYVLISSDNDTSGLLSQVGWRHIGVRGSPEGVMIGNAFDSLTRRGVNPIYWNYIWRDVSDYILESDTIRPVGVSYVMLRIYKAFGPLSKIYFKLKTLAGRNI